MALELMSPAGSFEGVVAAVQGGADAVYFGCGDFNARRNAKNLEGNEVQDALKYCRLRGVKTYITMNTLVTDRELLEAQKLILQLNAWGADALIVQDLGMAKLIRAIAPDMPIHASTQMTIHNLAGVMAAQELGFSRVVLSRELPLTEIAFICKNTKVEIEIFCHGALCMCYSGQCYFSSAVGGRSGNRGLCAQPCRMAYSFLGDVPQYHLSLKDLSLADHLKELSDAGVTCVKIEGRMKRPEYSALVTSVYKKALVTGQSPTRAEVMQMESVFSRDGFTDGYFVGQKGEHMFGVRGDAEGRDARELYKQAQRLYKAEPEIQRVPLDMEFIAKTGQRMRLICRDGDGNEYSAEGLAPEAAVNRPSTDDEIIGFLNKTGGTVYLARDIKIVMDSGLRASASAINALRRQCTEGLSTIRRRPPDRQSCEWQPGMQRPGYEPKPDYIFSFLKFDQITPAMLERKPDFVYMPLAELCANLEAVKLLTQKGVAFGAVLDRIIFDSQWQEAIKMLKDIRLAGVRDLVCTNIGQPTLLSRLGFRLRGDFGLNVMNSQSIKALRQMGLSSATISFEMNLSQVRDLSKGFDCELIAYGRLPLMITENCIIKKRTGACSCDGKQTALVDKTGRAFPLMKENGCRTTVYNCEKLYLADKLPDLESIGVRHLRLCFTTENPKECESIIDAYYGGKQSQPERITRGLYYRGVQ